jgi:large subunit ribosomal protein L30
VIDRPEKQKRTVKALGLGKINRSVEKENNDSIAGMIRKVSHLIKVEEI